jgi:hypothetical protein
MTFNVQATSGHFGENDNLIFADNNSVNSRLYEMFVTLITLF